MNLDLVAESLSRDLFLDGIVDLKNVEHAGNLILAALRKVEAEAREDCARIAEGFERNRDWVPGSLYDTLRRETAAAIRSSIMERVDG